MCVKYGARGADAPRRLERLAEREVRRMRPLAQRVEHQHVEAFAAAARTRRGWRLQSVRYAKRPNRKPRIGRCAVPERNRLRLPGRRAQNGPIDAKQLERRQAAAFRRRRIEDVAETSGGCRRASARRRSTASTPLHQRVEPPDVVDAQDVVGVAVREEDRVDAARSDGAAPARAGPARRRPGPGRRAARRRWRGGGARRADRSTGTSRTSQPIMGTPCDVPVPRNVMRIAGPKRQPAPSGLDDPALALLGLDEAHAQARTADPRGAWPRRRRDCPSSSPAASR